MVEQNATPEEAKVEATGATAPEINAYELGVLSQIERHLDNDELEKALDLLYPHLPVSAAEYRARLSELDHNITLKLIDNRQRQNERSFIAFEIKRASKNIPKEA